MKRILSTLLCVIILINFIFANCSYAEQAESSADESAMPDIASEPMEYSENVINDMTYEGDSTDPRTGETAGFNIFEAASFGVVRALLGIVCMIFNIVPLTAELLMTIITADGTDAINSITSANNEFSFSIERTVFNEIGIFNIDYFDFGTEVKKFNFFGLFSESEDDTVQIPNSMITIKKSVAQWFYISRAIALSISLLVLIYVGIRMAISTVASDKAKYKSMLIAWVEAMILLFLLHYIIQIFLVLGNLLLDLAYKVKEALVTDGKESFEQNLLNTIVFRLFTSSGTELLILTLMIWCLAFTHFRFFLLYIKRTIMVGFLIIVAPFVTVTYPIDKMGDNKAQAFGLWLKELMIHIFIQPIHAIIYLIFAFTAGEIATFAPIFGLLFLMAIPSAEKMVRNIFELNGSSTIEQLQAIGKKKK